MALLPTPEPLRSMRIQKREEKKVRILLCVPDHLALVVDGSRDPFERSTPTFCLEDIGRRLARVVELAGERLVIFEPGINSAPRDATGKARRLHIPALGECRQEGALLPHPVLGRSVRVVTALRQAIVVAAGISGLGFSGDGLSFHRRNPSYAVTPTPSEQVFEAHVRFRDIPRFLGATRAREEWTMLISAYGHLNTSQRDWPSSGAEGYWGDIVQMFADQSLRS
jgi:hypothetical protein